MEEMICSIEAALFAWDQALNDINWHIYTDFSGRPAGDTAWHVLAFKALAVSHFISFCSK